VTTARTHAEWRNRVVAEYGSAALTAQVLHALIQCGMPDALCRTAIRIVGDELDHAQLSHDTLVALGGEDAPAPLDVQTLARPAPEGPLAFLVDAIGRNFVLGETFAVPLFAAMREGTTHPVARATLDRVLRDEAVHRAFGWDALDALLEREPDGVRARLTAALPRWLVGFREGYGTLRPEDAPTEEERGAGLIPIERYVAVHTACLAEDIGPWLARRGIAVS
jgi:hypothetical protein